MQCCLVILELVKSRMLAVILVALLDNYIFPITQIKVCIPLRLYLFFTGVINFLLTNLKMYYSRQHMYHKCGMLVHVQCIY